jgi:hypothetical protein
MNSSPELSFGLVRLNGERTNENVSHITNSYFVVSSGYGVCANGASTANLYAYAGAAHYYTHSSAG